MDMGFAAELEDLCAMVAIAATVPPDRYPKWSDGYKGHMAALSALWSQLRPNMARHRLGVIAIDWKVRAVMVAYNAGNTHEMAGCAVQLYCSICEVIDRDPLRWPFHMKREAVSAPTKSSLPSHRTQVQAAMAAPH